MVYPLPVLLFKAGEDTHSAFSPSTSRLIKSQNMKKSEVGSTARYPEKPTVWSTVLSYSCGGCFSNLTQTMPSLEFLDTAGHPDHGNRSPWQRRTLHGTTSWRLICCRQVIQVNQQRWDQFSTPQIATAYQWIAEDPVKSDQNPSTGHASASLRQVVRETSPLGNLRG